MRRRRNSWLFEGKDGAAGEEVEFDDAGFEEGDVDVDAIKDAVAELAALVADVEAADAELAAAVAELAALVADVDAAEADVAAAAASTNKSHLATSVFDDIGCEPVDVCAVLHK